MRMTDIFQIARQYLTLGIIAAVFLAGIFCIGYFIVYKKILHGTQKLPLKKLAVIAIMFCYLIVVIGATMLDRGGIWGNRRIDLRPFIAYRTAWNDFSVKEWRNIILNICMFLPLGFLLPLCGGWWQRCYRTYLTGFAFTVFIELVQLITKRGIFELDDIFNNLLGTMIGYGIYRLLRWIYGMASSQRERFFPVLLFQIPLAFTVALFGTIFTVYRLQEFGNLSQQSLSKVNMTDVDLALNAELSEGPATAPVYQMHVADKEETHRMAQELFEKLGTQIDENENDIYDETAVYYSLNRKHCVWIDYAGCQMQFYDFSADDGSNEDAAAKRNGCSRSEIETALQPYGILVPAEAAFQNTRDGEYTFVLDEMNDDLCKGNISCTYIGNGTISQFHNSMTVYQKVKDCEIISAQEAYEQLKIGKFRGDYYTYTEEISSIVIDTIQLTYATDSKGFDQPVYTFSGTVNGEEAKIQIPALK